MYSVGKLASRSKPASTKEVVNANRVDKGGVKVTGDQPKLSPPEFGVPAWQSLHRFKKSAHSPVREKVPASSLLPDHNLPVTPPRWGHYKHLEAGRRPRLLRAPGKPGGPYGGTNDPGRPHPGWVPARHTQGTGHADPPPRAPESNPRSVGLGIVEGKGQTAPQKGERVPPICGPAYHL